MVQSGENIWTLRFQLLLGLTLAGEIILGIVVYRIFEYSYAHTELALTAFLLVCGILAISTLQQPVARRIILGAGGFILLALLALLAAPGPVRGTGVTRQPAETLRQFLASGALVLALVALLGKIVTDRAARVADMTYERHNWFSGLEHLALAVIAGVELLLQISAGNQIRVLPFGSVLYAGLSLNTITIILLGVLVVFSLVSFSSTLTWLDGLTILILGAICSLFQYTFGSTELAQLDPALSQGLISNINLVLSLAPLVLAALAIFAEWARFVAPLWLALQLLLLQPFVAVVRVGTGATRAGAGATTRVGARAGSVAQTASPGQIILAVLAIALVLLALRLILYWDRRGLNGVDGITVAVIALAIGLAAWSLGQGDLHRARVFFTAYGLMLMVYVIAICAILALALVCIHTFFSHSTPWLSRLESVVGILLTLSITLGSLFLLNTTGGQGSYTTATTLNPHAWNPALPPILLPNKYLLDGLFVILLVVYIIALVRRGWGRRFAHTERALLLLSGITCLLVLADTERGAVLPLVTANMQRLGAYSRATFSAESIAATGILIAALISLLWFLHGRTRTERIVLAVLPGAAALCVLIYDFSRSPLFLLCALLLLTAVTLIATRIERAQPEPQRVEIEDGDEIIAAP